FAAFASGVDVEERHRIMREKPGNHSLFMDIYAARTRKYMAASGATAADFAAVCMKSRRAASFSPWAQFKDELSESDVLNARVISAPLTLPMCSPIADGAAAAIVVSESVAKQLGCANVEVRASKIVSANRDGIDPVVAVRAGQQAYDQAGLGPGDVHVAEVHDASAPAEIMLYERLSIGQRIIPDYISRFTERFPRASLSIVEGYSQSLAEQVVMGKLDFALLLNPQASPNLVIDPVGPEVLYLIGTKPVGDNANYVNLSDIGGVPLIMPHTIHTIRPLVEYEAARLGVMLNIAFEIDSVRSISELVQKGRGHTVTP